MIKVLKATLIVMKVADKAMIKQVKMTIAPTPKKKALTKMIKMMTASKTQLMMIILLAATRPKKMPTKMMLQRDPKLLLTNRKKTVYLDCLTSPLSHHVPEIT